MVALLATASLGAVWSICAPDMGTNAVLDRFRQIAPKALIAVDGVHYAGRDIDRMAVLAELRAGLPSVEHVVLMPNLDRSEEHTSELQSPCNLVCRLLLEKKKKYHTIHII